MKKRKKDRRVVQEHAFESKGRPIEPDLQQDASKEEEDKPALSSESAAESDHDDHVALMESPEVAVRRLTAEMAEEKERYLRLAAEFDNFRKRVDRQRNEIRQNERSEVVRSILETLDNLARVTALDANDANVSDVIAGVQLVERSLLRELESLGLTKVGGVDERFDPHDHEAVSTVTALADDKVDLVAAVFQVGYRLGGTLLRPARVQVYVAPADDEDT